MTSLIDLSSKQPNTIKTIWGRTRRAVSIARLKPFDTATEQGRSDERMRRVFLSAAASASAKAVTLATTLISIPLTLHYLGSERYGMWMVMSSLTAMLSFADLGVGNGVLNLVAAAHGRDDRSAMRDAISSGFAVLSVVALALLLTLAVVYRFVPWPRIFNVVSPQAQAEAGPAIAVFLICFALAIPANIVQRVQMGLQQGFVASLWLCAGSVLALIGVLLAVRFGAGLPWLVLAFVGGPLIASLLNSMVFFTKIEPDIGPRLASIGGKAAWAVMRTGALFFALQMISAVMFSSDNLIIAQVLGPEAVPQYAVPERLFSMISVFLGMTLSPLWASYREALTRGDIAWTRRTLKRTLTAAIFCATTLSIPLLFAAPFLIRHWVGGALAPPFMLLTGLALWKIIEAARTALVMFLNGAHVVVPQLIIDGSTAFVSITLEIVLLRAVGITGAVWATVIAFIICSTVPYVLLVRRVLRQT